MNSQASLCACMSLKFCVCVYLRQDLMWPRTTLKLWFSGLHPPSPYWTTYCQCTIIPSFLPFFPSPFSPSSSFSIFFSRQSFTVQFRLAPNLKIFPSLPSMCWSYGVVPPYLAQFWNCHVSKNVLSLYVLNSWTSFQDGIQHSLNSSAWGQSYDSPQLISFEIKQILFSITTRLDFSWK